MLDGRETPKSMQEKLHEITSDETTNDETISDENTDATGGGWQSKSVQVTAAHGRGRCNWAGFRHGLAQWRRWHWILGTSIVDNMRKRQVAESQMVMGAMWQRKLLGNRWQVIRARMQDRQEVEDMRRMATAAELALRLAQRRGGLE